MTGLPGVNIDINNKGLGQTNQTEDTIAGLIITGTTVAGAGNVTQGNTYQLFALQDAVNIGIVEGGTNDFAYKQVKHFYDQAGQGAELWIMLVTAATQMSTIVDKDEADYAVKLLDAANGRIRTLAVSQKSAAGVTVANGVDEDVDTAAVNAQELAEQYAGNFKPLKVVIDGKDFNGEVADLKDYKTSSYNRVSILLAGTTGKNAAIGLLIGRLASNPVQRSVARVRDGELRIATATFTDGNAIEDLEAAWDAIINKGYIFLRTVPAKAGYYFTSDVTLTEDADDLNSIKRVAVIDKVTLITLGVATDYINDEIPLNADGTIASSIVGLIKAQIENAINGNMTDNGEISGCKATIDPAQNIVSTNELKVRLDILPVAYSKYIQVDLGFTTSLTNN